ncbi:MAG: response regulator transcription factor, partial [Nitrospira sp.]|nr:response regulator transcription factor [Nitrospira sp.]
MNTIKRARLFLVDDHILVLESCKKLLEPHHDIVGEAHSANDLVGQIRQTKPDILLMDISMPDQNGYEAARILKTICPSVKIIFV